MRVGPVVEQASRRGQISQYRFHLIPNGLTSFIRITQGPLGWQSLYMSVSAMTWNRAIA
jgi:hypothetical protein